MKKILLIAAIGLVLILAISLFAFPSPAETVSWEVPTENFMNQPYLYDDQVEVPVGALFTLLLGSNPTTGFQWSEHAIIASNSSSSARILKQVSHEYIAPDSEMPGAAGKEAWTFETVNKGSAIISMEYSRPWEGGEKAEWAYAVTVTVY
jgi:predicted secreted protein